MGANRDISKLGPLPTTVGGAFVWTTAGWAQVTKANVGLANVDNTADSAKPVSVAQQAALDAKANINSPTINTPTFNGNVKFNSELFDLSPTNPLNVGFEIGHRGTTATTPYLDFHSGAAPTDYDVRILVTGGNGSNGNGNVRIFATEVQLNSDIVPNSPLTRSVGTPASRFAQITGVVANFSGPVLVGQYTLTTLPSASAYAGYEIDVTNATGGSKRCRSNGSVWQILNTTTTVS